MILVESAKESAVTNIDIVKPIEARNPIPVSWRHVIVLDMFPNLSLVSTHVESKMPIVFLKRYCGSENHRKVLITKAVPHFCLSEV